MQVALFGGSGFIGGYLIDALLDAGHDLAVLVRSGSASKVSKASMLRIVEGDIANAQAVNETLRGCDALVYSIGILRERKAQGITFSALQLEGVKTVANAALTQGVQRFVLMSANGSEQQLTPYQKTKYQAESAVASMGFDYTVLRPSVVFGDPRRNTEFATRLFEQMIKPPFPAIDFHGGRGLNKRIVMSPVHVEDVAHACAAVLARADCSGQTFVLGGPEELSWKQILQRIAAATNRRKLYLPMPTWLMRAAAAGLEWLPFFPITRDQLTMLEAGNVAPADELVSLIEAQPKAFNAEQLKYLNVA